MTGSKQPALAFLPQKKQVWLPIALFFIGLWLTSLAAMLIDVSSRNALLVLMLLQDIMAFILPAYLTARLLNPKPIHWLRLNRATHPNIIIAVVITFIVAIPALNHIVALNEAMSLPDWAADVERIMRQLEENAQNSTSILIGDTSTFGLISSLLVVGVIGPFAEEIFFRGTLQHTITGAQPWKAVCWTAFFFSLIHFQMYGFLPRLLLGLWFGYLCMITQNLRPAIFAHALNNSTTIVMQWLVERGVVSNETLQIGADDNTWVAGISLALTTTTLMTVHKILKHKNGKR